jgi:hypothetical protein
MHAVGILVMKTLRLDLLPSSPFFPTASELRIASECVAPWALGLPETSETNEWAEMGRACHFAAETIARGQEPSDPRLRAVPDKIYAHLVSAMTPDMRENPKNGFHIEQGIKWRPGVLEDEAEFCERQPGERLRGWFAGTTDLAYVRRDNLLVIPDWKFGPREHVNGEPAKESCQGFFLALAFATKLGIRGSGPGVVVARFERRMVSESGIEVDAYDITQGELDAFAEQLRGLAKRIETAEGAVPRISAACGKCKARRACPGWDEMRDELRARITEDVTLLDRAPETPEEARFYHDAIGEMKREHDAAKERYNAFLALNKEGVPIGLGMREVGKRIERQNLVVSDTSIACIRERWGDAAFGAAKPALGRIEAAEKAKKKQWSKTDWGKRKLEIREGLRMDGILLAPSVYTQAVTQRLVASKWVDVKPEKRDDEEETED